MKGIIKSYARSRRNISSNRVVVQLHDATRTLARGFSGRTVVLRHGQKTFTGTVVSHHGDKGRVHVRFSTPIPAQALRQQVELK